MIAAVRLLFRADAAFAKPEIYEYLEARSIGYAIRLRSNQVLQREIHLLECSGRQQLHPRESVPQSGLHSHQSGLSNYRDSPLLQWPGHGGAMDQRRQVRPELEPGCPATSSWPTR